MALNIEVKKQMEILTADATEVISKKELETKIIQSLSSGIPLKVKMGIDPTSPDVHLGHMVVYKKMRQFQDLGHKAVLIIGDYTARIGDPTGRNIERLSLTEEQVLINSETYREQIFKTVDPKKTDIHFQSSWFDKVTLQDILGAVSSFSVAHMTTHDTFKRRLETGSRLSLHEILYPVLQAWDSLMIKSDVELGGMDQKFNILCGRDMQKEEEMEPQVAILMPLLMGTDGRKMSKTFNNHIPVLSLPDEKFGRIMSIRDELILNFFIHATGFNQNQVLEIKERLKTENPKDIKIELAKEIITLYHSSEEAEKCEKKFIEVFSKKEIPKNIPEFTISQNLQKITSILREAGIITSISEGRRLINQGGLKLNGEKITDVDYILNLESENTVTVKAGKRRFIKIRLKC
jgi:tyrosyl-tRNA synthetase